MPNESSNQKILQRNLTVFSVLFLLFAGVVTIDACIQFTSGAATSASMAQTAGVSNEAAVGYVVIMACLAVISIFFLVCPGIMGLVQVKHGIKSSFHIVLAKIDIAFTSLSVLLHIISFIEGRSEWIQFCSSVTSLFLLLFYTSTASALRQEASGEAANGARKRLHRLSACPLKQQLLIIASLDSLTLAVLNIIDNDINAGEYILYLFTAAFILYAVFFRSVEALCAKRVALRILRWCARAILLLFTGVICFLAIIGNTGTATGTEESAIVLGTYLHGDCPGNLLQERLDAAILFMTEHEDIPVVMSGGQAAGAQYTEAEAMATYMIAAGIPKERLILENASRNTYDNFAYSREKLEQIGIDRHQPMVIVTNSFHCYRARCYAKLAGFTDISILPVYSEWHNIPTWYLREAMATVAFWITGA